MARLEEYKKNLKIAGPVALSQLGHIAVGVADSVMVGQLGGIQLAAATIAFSVFIPFMMLGIGVSYGISPLIAKAEGEDNKLEISVILKHSIILCLVVGLVLSLFLFFSAPVLREMKQPPEVVVLAIPFFRIMALSIIPLMIFQCFRQFAEGLAITKEAMYISLSGNLLNILLNYILIFGAWGVSGIGINGAAYSTVISRIVMAAAMFAFVYYFPRIKEYWRPWKEIAWSTRKHLYLLKMSLPVGIQLTLEAGAFGFAAIMVGWLGAREIAAHHVALNMAAVTYMAATGIASAATVRVGHEYGRKNSSGIRYAGFSALHIVLVFMGICAVGFILFRHSLPALYVADVRIEKIAVSLLLISAFFQLSDGVQVVGLGALRGIGDVRVPTALALIAYWFIGLPVGYLLAFPFNFGVEGIWYGLFTGLTVAAFLLLERFNRKSRKFTKQNF